MDEMKKKIINKAIVTDLLFISYFSLMPNAQLLLPNKLVSEYWLPFYFVSFFIASMPFIGKVKAYLIRVAISVFICILVGKIFLGNFHGYLFIFILVYMKTLIIPATLGFLAANFYKKIERQWLGNLITKNVKIISLVSMVVASVFFVVKNIKDENHLLSEVNKRLSLAKNIVSYYGETKTKDLNNVFAINAGIINGVYEEVDIGTLTHGYGGDIEIISDDYGISLIYYDIPNEEICHWFYYMNSPSTYGFEEIYVDEKSIETAGDSLAEEIRKKELCYSGSDNVTIRYTASYSELEKAYLLKRWNGFN